MDWLVRLLADGALILVLLIAAAGILRSLRGRFWSSIPVFIMAGLTSLVVGKVMSLLYQPEVARPFLELGVAPGAAYIDNPGFPSDHALLATVAVAAFYFATKNRPLSIALAIIVVVMGAARVVALVHTPADVIFGVAAGLSGAFWYMKLTKAHKRSTI